MLHPSLPAERYLPRCRQVRRASEHQKYVAQVVCVGYDVDIAVLNVEDEQFWRSMPLLPLPHGLPAAMSEVLTAGFPTGGEELATTRGECPCRLHTGPRSPPRSHRDRTEISRTRGERSEGARQQRRGAWIWGA